MRTRTRTSRHAGGSWAVPVRLHRDQRGQAMFVMVLYFFLLAGLLFLVLNSGNQLNNKVTLQAAADSTAFTGASWFCRGMNSISMANVANTQFLSLIVLLDSLETVTPPASQCIQDLVQNIGSAKAHKDFPLDSSTDTWLAVGCAANEEQDIQMLYNVVRGIPVSDYCTYDSGILWECIKLMDGFSHSMLKCTPLAAQREAIDIATRNHGEFGFLVPIWPALPAIDGQFADFRDAMTVAQTPNGKAIIGFQLFGYTSGMGPYTYWREPLTRATPMGMLEMSKFSVLFTVVSEKKLEMMFGGTDDRVTIDTWEMDYDAAKQLSQDHPERFRRTWWEHLTFNCPSPGEPPRVQDSQVFQIACGRRDPQGPVPDRYCYYYKPEMKWVPDPRLTAKDPSIHWRRAYDPGTLKPLNYPAGWPFDDQAMRADPSVPWPPDPAIQPPPKAPAQEQAWHRADLATEGADPRLAVWYRVDRNKSANYPAMGIIPSHPPVHEDGSSWPYAAADMKPYFTVTLWRFDGAELEDDTSLHRRYLPPAGETPKFAPIQLDPSAMGPPGAVMTKAGMMQWYTFNAFVYRTGAVADWGQLFVNPNPIDKTVAYAEAHVYNRQSYDLFTQYWQTKLTRQDRWKEIIPMLTQTTPPSGAPPDAGSVLDKITEDRVKPVRDMLNAYDAAFVKQVSH